MGARQVSAPATEWLRPSPYTGSRESLTEFARAITRAVRGEGRLWLGAFEPPQLIGPLTRPTAESDGEDCPPTPCAGCTCSKAGALAERNIDDVALVVPTSGSTGTPKAVAHSLATLKASIHATAYALEGHGAWFLFLPPTHIAGVQVIARAAVASSLLDLGEVDSLPATLAPLVPLNEHFGPATVLGQLEAWDARAGERPTLASLPLFTSFVPTQLERLVAAAESGDAAIARALTRFDAILVGGAASSSALLERARTLGARIVTTYGSSETAGGCVYNAAPLQGVELKVADDDRLMITAPSIALGYIYETGAFTHVDGNDPDTRARFFRVPELATTRLLLTSDLARLGHNAATGEVQLSILGRADDVIVSGGRKIVPQSIERVLDGCREFERTLVVAVPHEEWGEQAVALVVPAMTGAVPTQVWKADLATHLAITTALTQAGMERYEIPRLALTVPEIPLLASGKVDRAAARDLAREAVLNIEAFEYAKNLVTSHNDMDHHAMEFGGIDEDA